MAAVGRIVVQMTRPCRNKANVFPEGVSIMAIALFPYWLKAVSSKGNTAGKQQRDTKDRLDTEQWQRIW
jgi:hypothetical protein